jgi:hypothetical protein
MWPTRHGFAAWDTHAPQGGPGGRAATWTALLALGLLAIAVTFVLLQGVQARPHHGDGVSTDETSVHTTLCVECGWWMSPRDYRAHSKRLLCEVTNSRPVREPAHWQATTSGAAPRPHSVPSQEQQPQAHHLIAGGAGPSSTPSAADDTGAWELEAYLLQHMSGKVEPGKGIRDERKGHETQFREEALKSPLSSTPAHPTPHHTPPLTDAALKGFLNLMEDKRRGPWTLAPGGAIAWRQGIIAQYFKGSPFKLIDCSREIGYEGDHPVIMAMREDPLNAFIKHAGKKVTGGDNTFETNYAPAANEEGDRLFAGFTTANRCRDIEAALAIEHGFTPQDAKCLYYLCWSDKVGYDGAGRHIGHPVTLTVGACSPGASRRAMHHRDRHPCRCNAPRRPHPPPPPHR